MCFFYNASKSKFAFFGSVLIFLFSIKFKALFNVNQGSLSIHKVSKKKKGIHNNNLPQNSSKLLTYQYK